MSKHLDQLVEEPTRVCRMLGYVERRLGEGSLYVRAKGQIIFWRGASEVSLRPPWPLFRSCGHGSGREPRKGAATRNCRIELRCDAGI
jgi:hypothetical protein